MNYRTMLSATALICFVTAAVTVPAGTQQPTPRIVAPEMLQWSPTPVPGVKGTMLVGNPRASGVYVVLAKYDSGVKAPPHTHTEQRVVTVLSGTFYAGEGSEFDEFNTTSRAA
jgi:anti-sigma factor ChrR (cupin superfamily)